MQKAKISIAHVYQRAGRLAKEVQDNHPEIAVKLRIFQKALKDKFRIAFNAGEVQLCLDDVSADERRTFGEASEPQHALDAITLPQEKNRKDGIYGSIALLETLLAQARQDLTEEPHRESENSRG